MCQSWLRSGICTTITIRAGVDGLPALCDLREVVPRFNFAVRTTLQDCEAEVGWLVEEENWERTAFEEARVACVIAEQWGQALSELWRTLFTRSGLEVPVTSGDAVERLVASMQGRREWREELEGLRERSEQLESESRTLEQEMAWLREQ